MKFGNLEFLEAGSNLDLVAPATSRMLQQIDATKVYVAAINPELSDTAAFCEQYQVEASQGANCVIVEAKRGDKVWYAACMVLATDRLDVNGAVRKQLDARRVSFAPMEKATSLTGMEYGGITPIGLPEDWLILVDSAVASARELIIGSGVRSSKLHVRGTLLAELPRASVVKITKEI